MQDHDGRSWRADGAWVCDQPAGAELDQCRQFCRRKDPEKCNIAVSYTWRRKPTQSDQDEMEREVSRIAGQPVPVLHQGRDFKEVGRICDEFLNPAKRH